MNLRIVIVTIICCFHPIPSNAREQTYDQLLKKYLLDGYNPTAFPSDKSITVEITLAIMGIVGVKELDSLINLKVVLRQRWNDPRMRWNPADYGGLKQVNFVQLFVRNKVWTPDISIRILSGKLMLPNLDLSQVICKYDGTMYWSRPGQFHIYHYFLLEKYPFDQQEITIELESWMHTTDKYDIIPWQSTVNDKRPTAEYDPKYFIHLQWDIHNYRFVKSQNVQFISGNYSVAQFQMTLKRKSRMTMNIILIPAFMIAFSSIFGFILPQNTPYRVIYCTRLLLTLIMFLVMLTNFIPVNADRPLMELVFQQLITFVFFVVVFVVISQYYGFKHQMLRAKQKQESQTIYKLYRKIKATNTLINQTNRKFDRVNENQQMVNKIRQQIEYECKSMYKHPVLRHQILRPDIINYIAYSMLLIVYMSFNLEFLPLYLFGNYQEK